MIWNATWSFLKDQGRIWGKGFAATVAALVTILVTDNILAITYKPYYQPAVYTIGITGVLIAAYSKKGRWGPGFRKSAANMSAWILGIIAVILLQFERNDLTYFDLKQTLYYNLLVALAAVVLILSPWIVTVLSNLLRDMPTQLNASKQRRIPTIFIEEYIVQNPDQSLFDQIVALLQE